MTGIEELDDTERARILSIIREEISFPRHGVVTKVWSHTSSDDDSNHEVNVAIPPGPNPTQEHRRVPVAVPTSGAIAGLQEGDHVLVEYLAGSGNEPVVTKVLYADKDEDRAPIGNAGDIRISRGDIEMQLAGDGSTGRLALRSDPTADPDLIIEVDSSGTIRLGDPSGTMQPIARKGDAVEVTDPDSGTLTGTITGGSSDVEST